MRFEELARHAERARRSRHWLRARRGGARLARPSCTARAEGLCAAEDASRHLAPLSRRWLSLAVLLERARLGRVLGRRHGARKNRADPGATAGARGRRPW